MQGINNRKQNKGQHDEKDEFNVALDVAISQIRLHCPDDWGLILNYLERQSSMPELSADLDDRVIARRAMEKQGFRRAFLRLAQQFKK